MRQGLSFEKKSTKLLENISRSQSLTFSVASIFIGSGIRIPFSISLAFAARKFILFLKLLSCEMDGVSIVAGFRGKPYDWSV